MCLHQPNLRFVFGIFFAQVKRVVHKGDNYVEQFTTFVLSTFLFLATLCLGLVILLLNSPVALVP